MKKPKKRRDPEKIAARYNAEIDLIYNNHEKVLSILRVWYGSNQAAIQRLHMIGYHLSRSWAEIARYYLKKYFKKEWKKLNGGK